MKKNLLLIFLFTTTSFVTIAQTYNMGNNTVTSATGTLYDSGGAGGNYLDNEDYTFTICPSGGASCINLIFASLSLETCCDYIRVYDGSNASGILLGQYNGAALPPTLNALSGCLTVVFHSDYVFVCKHRHKTASPNTLLLIGSKPPALLPLPRARKPKR